MNEAYEVAVWSKAVDEAEAVVSSLLPRELPGFNQMEREDGKAGRRRGETVEDYAARCQVCLENCLATLRHAKMKLTEARRAENEARRPK